MNIEKRLKNVEQDPILNGLVKTFQSKMVKARILKLWLLKMARTQLIQKFPRVSFGIQFIKMLNLTLSLVKYLRNKVI